MKYVVTLNGKDYEVEVDELSEAIVTSVAPTAASAPAAPVATQPSAPATPAPAPVSGSGTAVKAPMPGTILKVNVTAGQSVKAGDIMFILENANAYPNASSSSRNAFARGAAPR